MNRRTLPGLRLLICFLAPSVSGCTTRLGTIPLATFDVDTLGVKMLRPNLAAKVCHSRLVGVSLGADDPPLDRAIRALLAADAEGNALTDLAVETSTLSLGIYDRTCVEVRANLTRTAPTVLMPALPGHHGAH